MIQNKECSIEEAKELLNWNTPKPEDDPDLCLEVEKILKESSLSKFCEEVYKTSSYYHDAQGKHSKIQRFFLNSFFYRALLVCGGDTFNQRYHLIYDGDNEAWLSYIRSVIVPYILDHQPS